MLLRMISNAIKWLEGNSRIAWALTISYMLLIFLISSIPYPEQPEFLRDKHAPIVEHILEYSILGLLLLGSFRSTKRSEKQVAILAVSIGILYGISDEIHQLFVPGRYCEFIDVMADSLGSVIGVMVGNSGRG